MKFWKTVLAVIIGVTAVSILSCMLLFGFVSALSGDGAQVSIPSSAVLSIDMSTMTLGEQTVGSDPISSISKDVRTKIGVLDAIRAINKAAQDPSIKFIYLKPDSFDAGIASLQELRSALVNFRKSGKAVISYTEQFTTGGYYLASVSDKIYSTSYDGLNYMFVGISSRLVFVKDLLDKIGVHMQLIKHGKYKSAGEMFTRNSPTPENLEQNQVMIDGIWDSYSGAISESRGISRERLDEIVDNLELCLPSDLVEKGIVDELMTAEELKSKLADLAVEDSYKDIHFISLPDYAKARLLPVSAKKKIAIIYADGEIVDGKDKENVAGERFASIIAKVRKDSLVKAVLLRVNSPGGSVTASERIKTELDLLAAEKPLVASYGDMAASGGYWISANCNKIFTNETTLTGSIGVFGMLPDFKGVYDNLHVNSVSVNSNRHSDVFSFTRPVDDVEYAFVQRSIESIYDRFTTLVSEGRDLEKDYVDQIGQGRVWTGADALKIGLADEIGTIEDALNWTAVAAGDAELENWNIVAYPRPQTGLEMMMENLAGTSRNSDDAASAVFGNTALEQTAITLEKACKAGKGKSVVMARMPFEMIID